MTALAADRVTRALRLADVGRMPEHAPVRPAVARLDLVEQRFLIGFAALADQRLRLVIGVVLVALLGLEVELVSLSHR